MEFNASLADTYLRYRRCLIESSNIRFLPARGKHPPAMIARFGAGTVTGVHLTKLLDDGLGKAGTDKDKVMIGPSVGQPIIVRDNPDNFSLVITEGIENAATIAAVTGMNVWAAGSSARIKRLIEHTTGFDRVYIAVDPDPLRRDGRRGAGPEALAQAQAIRPDVVPVNFAKVLNVTVRLDANLALVLYGAQAVVAAIEWCGYLADFKRGDISFHAMQNMAAMASSKMTYCDRQDSVI
jgi:hypothetical protein